MKFIQHHSGSSGNLYSVIAENNKARLLLDPGVTWGKIQKAIDYNLRGIEGILASHAHGERTPEQQAKIDAEKEKLNSTSGKTRTKKKNKTRKKPDSKYICRNCQSKKRPFKFDTPLMSGPEGRQTPICPNKECLSTNIVETKDLPEFMTDD